MTYRAPVQDIAFTLNAIAGIERLEGDTFPDFSADLTAAVLEGAGALASDILAPLNASGDRQGARLEGADVIAAAGFRDAYAQWVAGGWGAVPFDPAFGGQGLPRTLMLAVQEMVQGANMSFGLCPLLTQGAIEALSAHGTDEQRSLYLPRLISGEWTSTMCLTEAQAGSDVGALAAKAIKRKDGTYAVTGTKIFITWGEHDVAPNIIHLVLARLPKAPVGTRGLSLFLVPKFIPHADGTLGARNDVKCVGLEHKLGIHASPTCTMAFGEEGGATGYLIGDEHRGMKAMFTMMNNARLNVGIQGVGVAEAALQKATAYAMERRQGKPFGLQHEVAEMVPITHHPDIRRSLMTMRALTEAARAICYETAIATDRSRSANTEKLRAAAKLREELLTPVAKAWSTDCGVEVASLGVQVHGGMGYMEETGAAQLLRDARIAPIYEGTNGIQAIDLVTRKLPMGGGEVVNAWLARMAELAGTLSEMEDEGLMLMGKALRNNLAELEVTTSYQLRMLRKAPRHALAGATPYLEQFGLVTGGALLARGALAAHKALEADPANSFMKQKRSVASFYIKHIMPRAHGLTATITAGDTMGDMEDAEFQSFL